VTRAIKMAFAQIDRKRLEDELALERDRLRLLLQINNAIISNLTEKALFHAICVAVRSVIPHDRCAIFLPHSKTKVMRLFAIESTVTSSRFVVGMEVDSRDSHVGWPFQHQQALLRRNLEIEREFSSEDALFSEGFHSLLSVPLIVKGQSIGAYCIASLASDRFSESESDLLSQAAGQIALAVENMKAYEEIRVLSKEMQEAAQRNGTLLEINNAIILKLTQNELFRAICTSLRRIMPYDRAALTLYDPDEQRLRFVALEGDFISNVFQIGQTLGLDDSHYGWAFSHRLPLLRRDMETEREFALEERAYDEGVRSFCAVPLIVQGESIGVICVLSYKKNQYSEADAEFLQAVANQIALAVKSYQGICAARAKLEAENVYLQEQLRTDRNFGDIVGDSFVLKSALHQVEVVAPTDSSVLILGETGTGKELIARAIHDLSGRRERAFVKLNCAAIPSGLLESELFGHEKGAFTGAIAQKMGRFELAANGTLFLDEVGDIPLELQAKLLRVLQEREFERLGSNRTHKVDVRIVAATHRDLPAMVKQQKFREDLYYRLKVFPIQLPPLRERSEDISKLVRHFVDQFAHRMGKTITQIPREMMEALVRYPWPGNVRELQNFLERAVILSPASTLRAPVNELQAFDLTPTSGTETNVLVQAEREQIIRALEESHWVVGGRRGAASRLGLKRTSLLYKMNKLGIRRAPNEVA
jgi:formate hydrogenlyase transcriptional activator